MLPHVISLSYAIIAALIKRFVTIAENSQQIDSAKICDIWAASLERETVPRRFGPRPGQVLRSAPIAFDLRLDED